MPPMRQTVAAKSSSVAAATPFAKGASFNNIRAFQPRVHFSASATSRGESVNYIKYGGIVWKERHTNKCVRAFSLEWKWNEGRILWFPAKSLIEKMMGSYKPAERYARLSYTFATLLKWKRLFAIWTLFLKCPIIIFNGIASERLLHIYVKKAT